jgi:hypothetical protein
MISGAISLLILSLIGLASADVRVIDSGVHGMDIEITTPLRMEATGLGTRLSVSGWPTTTEVGKPAIPYVVIPVALPPTGGFNAMVISRTDTSANGGTFLSAQADELVASEADKKKITPFLDGATGSFVTSTGPLVSTEFVGKAGDVRIGRIAVRPVSVNGGTVRWAKTLRIAVRFTSPPASTTPKLAISRPHPAGFVANAGQVSAFRARTSSTRRLASVVTDPPGKRIRITVFLSGIYRITGEKLIELGLDEGIDFTSVDPRKLRVTHRGKDIPLFVVGDERETIDKETVVEFYAEPNLGRYQAVYPELYRDPYVDAGIYLLSWDGLAGARMSEESGDDTPVGLEDSVQCYRYRHTVHLENDYAIRRLSTIDDPIVESHYWRVVGTFSTTSQSSFSVTLEKPHKLPTSGPTVEFMGRGETFGAHTVDISLNELPVGTIGDPTPPRDNALLYLNVTMDDRTPPLNDGTNTLRVRPRGYSGSEIGESVLVNWFRVTYERYYETGTDQLVFRRCVRATSGVFDYTLTGFSRPDISIYKIGVSRFKNFAAIRSETSPTQPKETYSVRFRDRLDGSDPLYIAVTDDKKITPTRMEVIEPWTRSLKDPTRTGDYIIIAHPALIDSTRRLAEHRATIAGGGFTVSVVNTEQIYDEFGEGYPVATAIRDFIRFAAENWSEPRPTHVVIVGHGIYRLDQKALSSSVAYVPTLRETAFRFGRVGSDYGFGLLDDNDILPDLFVGRIPAAGRTQLRTMIDKIIAFEAAPDHTPWRQSVLLVGSGSAGERVFASQCETLSHDVPDLYAQRKVYTGLIPDGYDVFTGDRSTLLPMLNEGSLWSIYLGHGGGGVWGNGRLLVNSDVPVLKNSTRPGIFLSMTCFTGAFEGAYAGLNSLGEEMLFGAEGGGAVAWLGSTNLGWVNNDYYLTQSLVWTGIKSSYERRSLGEIITAAKSDYLLRYGGATAERGEFQHTIVFSFNLLGDPGLQLVPPKPEVTLVPSTRTPVSGETLTIVGTCPAGGDATAEVTFYDDRQLVLDTRTNLPVTAGSFSTTFTVPPDLFGDGIVAKAYMSRADGSTDFTGAARMTVAGTLIDSVTITRLARNSIYVGATIIDVDGIASVRCIADLEVAGTADTVTMVTAGSGRYRTERPLDVSGVPVSDPSAWILPRIEVRDVLDSVTVHDGIGRVYPNREVRLAVSSIDLGGAQSAELTFMVLNTGTLLSDSLRVRTWLATAAGDVLLEERVITPLSPALNHELPANDQTVVVTSKAARTGVGTGGFIPQRTTLVVPLPDSIPRGELHERTLRIQVSTVDGVVSSPETFYTIPIDRGMALPGVTDTLRIRSVGGLVSATIPPGTLSTASFVLLGETSAIYDKNGQPDILPFTDAAGTALKAATVSWAEDVGIPSGKSVDLLFPLGFNRERVQSAFNAGTARVARWNENQKQWELLAGDSHEWSESGLTARISRRGSFGIVSVNDNTAPVIRVMVQGQHFSADVVDDYEGDYVGMAPRFQLIIEDRNGVRRDPGAVRVWVDDVALSDSALVSPGGAESPTSMPVTISITGLEARSEYYTMRIAAEDMAGNSAERTVRFRIAQEALLRFLGNYPNPFGRGGTRLTYELSQVASLVEFKIYDLSGRLIIKFDNYDLSELFYPDIRRRESGTLTDSNGQLLIEDSYHEILWPGYDRKDRKIPNGVYFGVLRVKTRTGDKEMKRTFKMVKAE